MKVLVIEDDQEVVMAISLLFQVHWPEAQLMSTHLGEKGIDMVREKVPHIVVLDLSLPDIDGFEVLKQIRFFSSVPVMVLMAREGQEETDRAMELGANEYVVKPYRPVQFLERIKAQVAG